MAVIAAGSSRPALKIAIGYGKTPPGRVSAIKTYPVLQAAGWLGAKIR